MTNFNIIDFLVQKLQSFFKEQGKNKAVVGVSGGLDSSVVAVLAAMSLGSENVEFYFLPSKHTSQLTRNCLKELSKKFDILIREESGIVDGVSELVIKSLEQKKIGHLFDQTKDNIQSRARMIWLMSVSNQTGGLLLNCSNRSEILTGYCTLYGDTAGAICPIAHLYKTEVYELGEMLALPRLILERFPTAELRSDQRDSDDLIEYKLLDEILKKGNLLETDFSCEGQELEDSRKVWDLVRKNSFKSKQFPPPLIQY